MTETTVRAVTGTNMFARSMGSAVGAAVFGAVANPTLTGRLAHPPAAIAGAHLDPTRLVLGGAIPTGDDRVTAFREGRFVPTRLDRGR